MNTSKKNIILALVVVALLGAAGWVLYSGVFKTDSVGSGGSSAVPETEVKQSYNLLPYGKTLDFSPVENRPGVTAGYKYQLVNLDQEVGLDKNDLVRNIVAAPLNQPQQFLRPADNTSVPLANHPAPAGNP